MILVIAVVLFLVVLLLLSLFLLADSNRQARVGRGVIYAVKAPSAVQRGTAAAKNGSKRRTSGRQRIFPQTSVNKSVWFMNNSSKL